MGRETRHSQNDEHWQLSDQLFDLMWKTFYHDDYYNAIELKQVDRAHQLWSDAAEHFLFARYHHDDAQRGKHDTPMARGKPRRSKPLPTVKRVVGERYANITQSAKTSRATTIYTYLGKVKNLKHNAPTHFQNPP